MKIVIALLLSVFLFACTGSKERVKLDSAVNEVVKAVNVGVAAGYIDQAKAMSFWLRLLKDKQNWSVLKLL